MVNVWIAVTRDRYQASSHAVAVCLCEMIHSRGDARLVDLFAVTRRGCGQRRVLFVASAA